MAMANLSVLAEAASLIQGGGLDTFDFAFFCSQHQLLRRSYDILVREGCNTISALAYSQEEDISNLSLGIGQTHVLQCALGLGPFRPLAPDANQGKQDQSQNIPDISNVTLQAQARDLQGLALGSSVNPAAAGTSRLLGLGPSGESVSY